MICSLKVAFLFVFYTGMLRRSLVGSVWWNDEEEKLDNDVNKKSLRLLNPFFSIKDFNLNRNDPSNDISYDNHNDEELEDEYYGNPKIVNNRLFAHPSKLTYGIEFQKYKNNDINNFAKNKIVKLRVGGDQERLMGTDDSYDKNVKNEYVYEDSGFNNDYGQKNSTEDTNEFESNNDLKFNSKDKSVKYLGNNKAGEELNKFDSNDDIFMVGDSENKAVQTTKHLKNSNFLFRSPNFFKSNLLGDTRRTYDRRSENSIKQFDLIIQHPCTSISASRLSEDQMRMLGAIKVTNTESENNFKNKLLSKFHHHRTLLKTVLEKMIIDRFNKYLAEEEFGQLGGVYNGMTDVINFANSSPTTFKKWIMLVYRSIQKMAYLMLKTAFEEAISNRTHHRFDREYNNLVMSPESGMRSILCDINIHDLQETPSNTEQVEEWENVIDDNRFKRNVLKEQQRICRNLETVHKIEKKSGFSIKYGIVNDILYGGVSPLDENAREFGKTDSIYKRCKKLAKKSIIKKRVPYEIAQEKRTGAQIDILANLTSVSSNTQRYERDYSFLRDCYNVFGKFHQQLKLM